ncbi:SRPBCC family protein [Zhongshania guokunii]|uniref:SRPBCC family protein n=1 Tax=Zhongshania guokunii TaxID=641783 RepID=A0ABV3U6L6_9GAMM
MKHEATARVVIDLPKAEAWALLRDLSLAHNYVPAAVRTEITSDKPDGLGASRRIYQRSGKGVDETITEWNEGHGFVIRLHKGEKGAPLPFRRAAFRYRLEDAGHSRTALTTSLIFDMRWGYFGQLLYERILHYVFRGIISDIALGMKQYYESGEVVNSHQLKQLRIGARQEV